MVTKVLSVGGSIIAPAEPDAAFLSEFCGMITDWLLSNSETRLILVAGGGGPARLYQNAYRTVAQGFTEAQRKAYEALREANRGTPSVREHIQNLVDDAASRARSAIWTGGSSCPPSSTATST